MTRTEAFRHMSDVVNHHLFPLVKTSCIKDSHRIFVVDFVQQLYDMLNTALKNPNDPHYRFEYESESQSEDDDWSLSVSKGDFPAQPNSHNIHFNIQGCKNFELRLTKTDAIFDRSRERRAQYETIIYNSSYIGVCSLIELRATRKGQDMRSMERVFCYINGQPEFDNCTYKNYL